MGVIVFNVPYGVFVPLSITYSQFTIGGVVAGFDSSKSECSGASYLGLGWFHNNVGELKIATTLVTQL